MILLGAPGAGKGTQAKMIARHYNLQHISTGDLLRSAVAEGTELGRMAKGYMDSGKLVPDDVILGIIEEYMAKGTEVRVLFDGFPRTIAQATGLDKLMPVGAKVTALSLDVPDDAVITRLSARVTCKQCGRVYNPLLGVNPPNGHCECGGEIYQRDDDKPETIANRLKVYHEQTEPIIGFYGKKGVLANVDGLGSPDEVFKRVKRIYD